MAEKQTFGRVIISCNVRDCVKQESHLSKQVSDFPLLSIPFMFSVWTEESSCTVLNSSVVAEINCTYSCGSECWKSSRYPCLQVFVSLNASGRVLRLSHNEEAQDSNPEVSGSI